MSTAHIDAPAPRRPLRLWPGVLAAVLLVLVRGLVPIVRPEAGGTAMVGGIAGGLAIVLWWLFFSRAPWSERIGAILLMIVAVAAASRLVHESIANGMMGFMLPLFAIPVLSLALVAWAAATRHLSSGRRRAWMAVAILLAAGPFTLIRTNGITGNANSDLQWRWTPTSEERLLARTADEPLAAARPASSASPPGAPPATPLPAIGDAPAVAAPPAPDDASTTEAPTQQNTGPAWTGFRGPARDSVIRGVRIGTDWTQSPPVELWRRPIGPGWSSFAVAGDLFYTQEQRGEDEIVSAYSLKTGEPVWRHRDAARFWESNGGPGPRATPTVSGGRVYALGATGILNALDAHDGSLVWSRNAASDTGATVPDWGVASSPLVVGDLVVAATAGSLAAYDAATGEPRWFGPGDGWGYSSPHWSTIDGVPQIVLLNGPGAIGVAPSDGALLWTHAWPGDAIVQPAVISNGDFLIASGSGLASNTGMLRVTVAHEAGGWRVSERWTSIGLKPYFNDFVVHEGHAFGFDGSILACIDVESGTRQWKGGRYGHGQLMLFPQQDLLLVLSEEGELALVRATPDRHTELARFRVLEGKTWNHPVLVGDTLLVRNGEEMAAFRLALEGP